jgi:LPPG:FO 2-phospho-L-lactate transferase
MRVVCLAGGVGGAKLADGLQQVLAPGELTVIVNTGDDFERHSLLVSPDHDTVVYTLAGIADFDQGWGIARETWQVMDALTNLGEETWFRLGDRDLATHLFRTERLRRGERPTDVALALQRALGLRSRVLPMTDEPVRTQVRTADGWLDFQDYFVRLRQQPEVIEVRFEGVERSKPTPEVIEALSSAELIVITPSNPIVSVGPILAVPGLADGVRASRGRGVRVVAVSGIVGGKALRGPADRMLAGLGEEVSAFGVARRYCLQDVLDVFVLDHRDEALAERVQALGPAVVVTETIMSDLSARARLAGDILAAASPTRVGQ